jgi:NAD(P)-dependent dehydrogenase (short-subunit alcohol dehydrogenase family)
MRVILVTGGNKGIGKALCEKILKSHSDTFVYLGSRDASRGSDALASIVDSMGAAFSSRIECLEMVGVSSNSSRFSMLV